MPYGVGSATGACPHPAGGYAPLEDKGPVSLSPFLPFCLSPPPPFPPSCTPPLPFPSAFLSCPACHAYTAGCAESNVHRIRCWRPRPKQPIIPPWRLAPIVTTMPLFLAVIRAKWAICRAGQGSRFSPGFGPDSDEAPSGFSTFCAADRQTKGGSSGPLPISVALNLVRPGGQCRRERRGGIWRPTELPGDNIPSAVFRHVPRVGPRPCAAGFSHSLNERRRGEI